MVAKTHSEFRRGWGHRIQICCRPMRILFDFDGDEVFGDARGLDD